MPLLKSCVTSANTATCPFPLNNLPYGVFAREEDEPHCGVAIGDYVLDLAAAQSAGVLGYPDAGFEMPYWNDFMELGAEAWVAFRDDLQTLLTYDSPAEALLLACLVPLSEVALHLPLVVAEFTDFYSSRHHARNVSQLFHGVDGMLPPNWLHMPIGYNSRASTLVVSGTEVKRPMGQIKAPDVNLPIWSACEKLDFELELGAIVGSNTIMGEPVTVTEADDMIFGYVLLNDWSARDIQVWENQPLGPFQAKAFATTISPWIVSPLALAPFRRAAPPRDVPLLPYLRDQGPMLFDITLTASLQPQGASEASQITKTNTSHLYYAAAQQLAHHASSGCAMTAGDLLGSGTISGPASHERGSLLELSWDGAQPITLDTGEARSFLQDGDRLTLSGLATGDGYQIGFGPCTGTIIPARNAS